MRDAQFTIIRFLGEQPVLRLRFIRCPYTGVEGPKKGPGSYGLFLQNAGFCQVVGPWGIGAAPVSGAVYRRCVIGLSRPGTCRVPMGWGFTMPKAWPYIDRGAFFRGAAGHRSRRMRGGFLRTIRRTGARPVPFWFSLPVYGHLKNATRDVSRSYGRGERKREVATKATSLQSRISS